MPVPNDWVTVRQLPHGEVHTACLKGVDGARLQVAVSPAADRAKLKTGDLVEVTSEEILYLGVVSGLEGSSMLISIEHTVDCSALATLQNLWQNAAKE